MAKLDSKAAEELAKKLASFKCVSRFNSDEYKEAWTMAYAFQDLENSFEKFLKEYLPRLQNEKFDETSISSLLCDIGDEFRHIFYHLRDTKWFKPYVDEKGISEQ